VRVLNENMPQNEHIELFQKRYGKRLDHEERKRKKHAREVHVRAKYAKKALGLKGKMFAKKRHQEKIIMKKTINMHEEKDRDQKVADESPQNAIPAYLMERDQVRRCFLRITLWMPCSNWEGASEHHTCITQLEHVTTCCMHWWW
jgi:hypothetical protein